MAAQIDSATIAGYFQPECKPVSLCGHPLPFGVETMKTEQTPKTAADILQEMRDDIAWLDERIEGAMCTLSSHGVVITMNGLPLGLDVDADDRIIAVRVYGWRGRYSRLTREDAQRLAPTIKNGLGELAQAFPLVVALENARHAAVKALSWAERAMAEQSAG